MADFTPTMIHRLQKEGDDFYALYYDIKTCLAVIATSTGLFYRVAQYYQNGRIQEFPMEKFERYGVRLKIQVEQIYTMSQPVIILLIEEQLVIINACTDVLLYIADTCSDSLPEQMAVETIQRYTARIRQAMDALMDTFDAIQEVLNEMDQPSQNDASRPGSE